jgi:hypothetical protein
MRTHFALARAPLLMARLARMPTAATALVLCHAHEDPKVVAGHDPATGELTDE